MRRNIQALFLWRRARSVCSLQVSGTQQLADAAIEYFRATIACGQLPCNLDKWIGEVRPYQATLIIRILWVIQLHVRAYLIAAEP